MERIVTDRDQRAEWRIDVVLQTDPRTEDTRLPFDQKDIRQAQQQEQLGGKSKAGIKRRRDRRAGMPREVRGRRRCRVVPLGN